MMFKYPELFCSAVPIAGGHQHEKRVSEHNGKESDGVVLDPGYNSWDLARQYAGQKDVPPLAILIVVGTRDFNYEANLEWMAHLQSLGIPFERRIVPETPHSADQLYGKLGAEMMQFHERCFAKAMEGGSYLLVPKEREGRSGLRPRKRFPSGSMLTQTVSRSV